MLKLALCEDDPEQRSIMQEIFRKYASQRPDLTIQFFIFDSGYKLLAAEEDEKFDLFVLDVVMPEISGIDLGIKLRELKSNGIIIYLTVSPEYALDSYSTRAFQYLMKPVQPEHFSSVLDQAIAELNSCRAASLTIKTKDGWQLARLDHIVYAELADRTIRYHLSDDRRLDSLTIRSPFQTEIADLLSDSRFTLCGATILVNLYYVTAVEKTALRLDNGEQLPLARSFASKVRQHWNDYWLNSIKKRI